MDIKSKMAILIARTGVFFANCDGDYDERERMFIKNFVAELKKSESDVTDDALATVAESLDRVYTLSEIIAETKSYLTAFNPNEKKALLDVLSDFISKVINADSVLSDKETENFAQWKSAMYE